MNGIKFDFDDILISPAVQSKINSRKEIDIFINGSLPLISSPMDRVYFNYDSYVTYVNNSIIPTIPRDNYNLEWKLNTYSTKEYSSAFLALSLDEIKLINTIPNILYSTLNDDRPFNILLDIANGHMISLTEEIKQFRKEFDSNKVKLMVGNIANPDTYKVLSDAGADYIRVSVGSGSACLTTQQTAVGYPMASLIESCYKTSMSLNNPAYIVADGGFKKYSDIIKALALGADYVMLGSILNRAFDNGGICYWNGVPFETNRKITKFLYKKGFNLYRDYRGMSTKEVQKSWGKSDKNLRTSEGTHRMNKIEYTVEGWVDNLSDYLRSAMSYTNAKNLEEFKGSEYIFVSANYHNRFKK